MCGFYKLIFLLICNGVIMGNCIEVVPRPDVATDQQIVRLSNISAITEGKLERTKRSLLDYLLYGLYEYFDYSDETDSEEEEKYLICRNCTIVISQSNAQGSHTKPSNIAPATELNGEAKPAADPSDIPMSSETPVDIPSPPVDTTQT